MCQTETAESKVLTGTKSSSTQLSTGLENRTGQSCLNLRKSEEVILRSKDLGNIQNQGARVLTSLPPGGKKPIPLEGHTPWLQKTGTLDKHHETETMAQASLFQEEIQQLTRHATTPCAYHPPL